MKAGAEVSFHLHLGNRGSRQERAQSVVRGRLPRVTEVMSLAIYIQEMVQRGEVADYADFARQRCVTRERISQVMKLIWLAPDIQVELLYLPPTAAGRYPITELSMRQIAEVSSWKDQRAAWEKLKRDRRMRTIAEVET